MLKNEIQVFDTRARLLVRESFIYLMKILLSDKIVRKVCNYFPIDGNV